VGSIRAIFEALAADIAVEVALPENADGTGGTTFDVDVEYGQAKRPVHPGANGRVIIAPGEGGDVGGPKVMNGRLQTLCTWSPIFNAHLWVPVGVAGTRTELDRLDAIESLIKCVTRAIYKGNHGATLPDRPPIDSANILLDPAVMKHGEAAVISFTVGIPIAKGRSLTTMPTGARVAVTIRANPEDS
jgi:hypothetical protein